MFHSMFMSKPASSIAPAFEPELDLCDLYEEELFEEFPNGEFPVPGVNYIPHLYAANCYGG